MDMDDLRVNKVSVLFCSVQQNDNMNFGSLNLKFADIQFFSV